jgi:hypothetical protein
MSATETETVVAVSGCPAPAQKPIGAGLSINDKERSKRYLHISATPCAVCRGPLIAGWTGVRQTEISKESEITPVGAVCLWCGTKPETVLPNQGTLFQFRPVEWEWVIDRHIKADEILTDPLPMELSQDSDRV